MLCYMADGCCTGYPTDRIHMMMLIYLLDASSFDTSDSGGAARLFTHAHCTSTLVAGVRGTHLQRHITLIVLLSRVGPFVNQQLHNVQPMRDGSQVQRPHTVPICCIQVHATPDEVLR